MPPPDVELVNDNLVLTGNSVVLTGNSVRVESDLLHHEGSPLVLSARDLFITWSISRAYLHMRAIGGPGSVGSETDEGRHALGHGVRIEGDVYADDLWLVSWEMSDPQALADLIELVEETRRAAGRDDEYLDEEELQAELDSKSGQGNDVTQPRLDDHFGDVDASKRDGRLPTLVEGLRSQQPKLVRRESSLLRRLDEIEARLEALEDRT